VERAPARAASAVVALADVLPGLPAFMLSAEGVTRAVNGCILGQRDSLTGESPIANPESPVRLLDPAGALVGIGRPSSSSPGLLHPSVVLM